MPAKCPGCGAEAKLEEIRQAGGRCPHCNARVKIKFKGVPRPVPRAAGQAPAVTNLKGTLESIGPYEVIAEISRGGMGIVYRALDRNLRRTVAIKVLIRGGDASEEERKRFQREAEATARLQHSNIVPIHAVGVCAGLPYFVMDFIEGEQLEVLISRGAVSPRQAMDITEQLADALAYAHAAGVIHRDIKPGNVIIDRFGRPQLMDFGLAKDLGAGDRTQLTQVGTTMGTPTYMPPEQAEGDLAGIDAQSDVYSLGAVLYEMLTGRPAFDGPTTMAILMKVLEEDPPRPRTLNPRIHPDIETICLKAMAKDKRDRYASAADLREDIRRFKAGEAISASPPGQMRALSRHLRRHRQAVAAVCLALAALLGWVGFDVWRRGHERRVEEQARAVEAAGWLAEAGRILASGDHSEDRLEHAAALYRRTLDRKPGRENEAAAREGLVRIEELRRGRRIGALLEMGDLFLRESNYLAAAHVYELVLTDFDPANARALEGRRVARGDGTLTVESDPPGAEIYLGVGKEGFSEPPLDVPAEKLGRRMGTAPLAAPVEVPMGFHRLTLVLKGYGRQSIPVFVDRNQKVSAGRIRLISEEAVGGREAAVNIVEVPAGTVVLEDGESVEVPGFYIDRYEYPNLLGATPVCGRTRFAQHRSWDWDEAQALAAAAGKSLPTREQWILAAGGPATPARQGGREFPYGDAFDPKAAACGLAHDEGPLASGSRPNDVSGCGAFDMAGNVAEWVRGGDEEQGEYGYPEEKFYYACGGSWTSHDPGQSACLHFRLYTAEDEADTVGLRCVLEKGAAAPERGGRPEPARASEDPADGEVWAEKCPPDMVLIRPQPGTPAWELVNYPFCMDAYEWPNRKGEKPWRGTWSEAVRLAAERGRRLPTRAEWRVACGGPQLLRYPFGEGYLQGKACVGLKVSEHPEPSPCGAEAWRESRSPWGGIYDLCGNVSEWVWDRPNGAGKLRGVVGGHWWSDPEEARSDVWSGMEPERAGTGGGVVGFRCVVRLREKPD